MGVLHPPQFFGDDVERFVPGHLDEAAAAPRPVAMLQPAFADGRCLDAAVVVHAFGHAAQDRRRIGIAGKGPDIHDAIILGAGFERSPVGTVGLVHGRSSVVSCRGHDDNARIPRL